MNRHPSSAADDDELIATRFSTEPVARDTVPVDTPEPQRQRPVESGPPPSWREVGATLLLVALCDLTIYRGQGFAGYACLFAVAPLLLTTGAVRRQFTIPLVVVAVMLAALVVKLLWCGSALLVVFGFGLLAAISMILAGQSPFIFELTVFASQTIRSGWEAVLQYGRNCNRMSPAISSLPLMNVMLPLAAFLIFSGIFVLANPDLLASVSARLELLITGVREWLFHFSFFEVCFWLVTGWLSLGLLRPCLGALQSPFQRGSQTRSRPALRPLPQYAADGDRSVCGLPGF